MIARLLQRVWRRLKTVLPSPVGELMTALLQSCLTWLNARRRTTSYWAAHERIVQSFTERAARSAHGHVDDEFFRDYAAAQIHQSLDATRGQLLGPLVMERTERLVRLMDQVLPADRKSLGVLCVGCRNAQELAHVERTCRVGRVRGLDLFSEDPRIDVGDMHAMPFEDGSFDVVYACHSLEHAYDLRQALAECVRVTTPGGLLVIEMPVHFPLSRTDLWDVGSSAALLNYLNGAVTEVLVLDDASDVVRMVVRVSGPAAHQPSLQPTGAP